MSTSRRKTHHHGELLLPLNAPEIKALRRIVGKRGGLDFAAKAHTTPGTIRKLKRGGASRESTLARVRALLANVPGTSVATVAPKKGSNGHAAVQVLPERERPEITYGQLRAFLEGQMVGAMAAIRFVEGA